MKDSVSARDLDEEEDDDEEDEDEEDDFLAKELGEEWG